MTGETECCLNELGHPLLWRRLRLALSLPLRLREPAIAPITRRKFANDHVTGFMQIAQQAAKQRVRLMHKFLLFLRGVRARGDVDGQTGDGLIRGHAADAKARGGQVFNHHGCDLSAFAQDARREIGELRRESSVVLRIVQRGNAQTKRGHGRLNASAGRGGH